MREGNHPRFKELAQVRRRVGFLFIFGALAPFVVFASTAWACGVLATLKSAPSTAAVGQTVSASGANYASNMTTHTPVTIRWDSRTGPVVKEVTPGENGKFSTTFPIPAGATAGDHILIATQNKISDGTSKSGTPGRTLMRVQGSAGSSSAPAASPWGSENPGSPGGSAASADAGYSPLLAIVLSLGLLTTGVALVRRDRGARGRPLGA